jgi:hypothetical protein
MARAGTSLALAALAAGAGAACSSSPAASSDADASTSGDDAGADATQPSGSSSGDAASDQAVQASCEPAKGPACDLVLQNCPAGKQCVAVAQGGGKYTTQCGPTYATQHIDRGYPCCPPSSASQEPCLPGLQCIGNPCTGDAGPGGGGGGRCAPYCCSGDDTPCASTPEGFAGHCNLNVVDGAGKSMFNVCDYMPPCKPLGLLPCPPGYACEVQDTSGSATCSQIFNSGGPPAKEGASCTYNNSCDDGLMCLQLTAPDGGVSSQCMMLCYTGQGTPPFNPQSLAMGPGTGGCNTGKQCVGAPNAFPPWLGVCAP